MSSFNSSYSHYEQSYMPSEPTHNLQHPHGNQQQIIHECSSPSGCRGGKAVNRQAHYQNGSVIAIARRQAYQEPPNVNHIPHTFSRIDNIRSPYTFDQRTRPQSWHVPLDPDNYSMAQDAAFMHPGNVLGAPAPANAHVQDQYFPLQPGELFRPYDWVSETHLGQTAQHPDDSTAYLDLAGPQVHPPDELVGLGLYDDAPWTTGVNQRMESPYAPVIPAAGRRSLLLGEGWQPPVIEQNEETAEDGDEEAESEEEDAIDYNELQNEMLDVDPSCMGWGQDDHAAYSKAPAHLDNYPAIAGENMFAPEQYPLHMGYHMAPVYHEYYPIDINARYT